MNLLSTLLVILLLSLHMNKKILVLLLQTICPGVAITTKSVKRLILSLHLIKESPSCISLGSVEKKQQFISLVRSHFSYFGSHFMSKTFLVSKGYKGGLLNSF